MTVNLSLDLRDTDYRALTAIATQRGIQAHVLIEQLVKHALATSRPAPTPKPVEVVKPKYKPKPMPLRSKAMMRTDRDEQWVEVLRLHGLGYSDAEVARAMGITSEMARRRRIQLKLPPLGKPGRRPRNENNKAATVAETSSK